jgi:hypothetical protein
VRSPWLWTDRSRLSATGSGAGAFHAPTRGGRGLTLRRPHARSCGHARATGVPSSVSMSARPTAASCAPKSGSPSGAGRSSGSLWRRPAEAARRADMTGATPRCSSITSIRRRNRSVWPRADSVAELTERARRRGSACFCVGTATRRWKRVSGYLRLPGVDSNHQELINSQSCCRYITGDRRGRA